MLTFISYSSVLLSVTISLAGSMRIPRTNFQPATSSNTSSEDMPDAQAFGLPDHPWPDNDPYAPVDTRRIEPETMGETSRFRSPILRASDPAHLVDGSLDSHFLMAPNVRFTRTPDRETHRELPAREPIAPHQEMPVLVQQNSVEPVATTMTAVIEPARHSPVALEIERLREAMSERRMMRWKTQAEAEPQILAERPMAVAVQPPAIIKQPAPASRLIEPIVIADVAEAVQTPVAEAHLPYLSDFAFSNPPPLPFPSRLRPAL